MYATSFKFRYHLNYPKLATQLYEEMVKQWKLPSLEIWHLLLRNQAIANLTLPEHIEMYALDNLLRDSHNDVVQVRFHAQESHRELSTIYLSLRGGEVANIHVDFPGRAGRRSSSDILAMIIDLCKTNIIPYGDLHMEIQGFSESEPLFIREHNLGAFVYSRMQGVDRWIHKSENPDLFGDVRRQTRRRP